MSNFDEDPSVYNWHLEQEILIDRPPAQVWKPLLDDRLWVVSHNIENVYGELGTLGFITRVSPKASSWLSTPPPRYHYCKVIKLIPEKQHVLKTYTEKGGSYGGQMIVFDDTRLIALGSQTKLVFNAFMELKSEAIAKDSTGMEAALSVASEGMMRNLINLKRIVESC